MGDIYNIPAEISAVFFEKKCNIFTFSLLTVKI